MHRTTVNKKTNNDMSEMLVQSKCEHLVACHNANVTRESVDICWLLLL